MKENMYIIQENRDEKWINKNLSFLVVTANENEKNAFESKLKPIEKFKKKAIYISKNDNYIFGIFGKYLVGHLHLKDQGSLKPGGSSLSIYEAFEKFKFCGVIMIGVAYGKDKNTQSIGDVLVSTKIQPIHSVKVATDAYNKKEIINRNTIFCPSDVIINIFSSIKWDSINFKNEVRYGTFLCGEELIDNQEYKLELIKRFGSNESPIIGGEMESNGMAAAMIRNTNNNWIVVKGICDFADGNKKENKDSRQIVAATNAVDFCYKIFSQRLFERIYNVKYVEQKRKADKQKEIIINGKTLYYYRNKKMMPLAILSKKSNINEIKLRKIEGLEEVHLTKKELGRLQRILDVEEDELMKYKNEKKVEYFFQNKGHKSLLPVEDSQVVFFDFDGTLTKNSLSVWELIWRACGYDESLCKVYHRQFVNGDITHKEWCDITLQHFKKANLDEQKIIDVTNKIELLDDSIETLKILKDNGLKLFIVSGAIKTIIENKFMEMIELFDEVKANDLIFNSRTSKLENIYETEYDYRGKTKYINNICDTLGIKPQDCIYIGNSLNDEYVYTTKIKTLVINPKNANHDNRDIWNYYIPKTSSLLTILPYVLPSSYTLNNCYF